MLDYTEEAFRLGAMSYDELLDDATYSHVDVDPNWTSEEIIAEFLSTIDKKIA